LHDIRTAVLNARHLFRNSRLELVLAVCDARDVKGPCVFNLYVCLYAGRHKLAVPSVRPFSLVLSSTVVTSRPVRAIVWSDIPRYINLSRRYYVPLRPLHFAVVTRRHLCAFLTRFSRVSSSVGEYIVLLYLSVRLAVVRISTSLA